MKWLYEATNAVPLTIKIATSGSKRLSACSDFCIRKTGASIPIGKIAIAVVGLLPLVVGAVMAWTPLVVAGAVVILLGLALFLM